MRKGLTERIKAANFLEFYEFFGLHIKKYSKLFLRKTIEKEI
jgi:hypothetical protein